MHDASRCKILHRFCIVHRAKSGKIVHFCIAMHAFCIDFASCIGQIVQFCIVHRTKCSKFTKLTSPVYFRFTEAQKAIANKSRQQKLTDVQMIYGKIPQKVDVLDQMSGALATTTKRFRDSIIAIDWTALIDQKSD